ncbi:hypothetical protein JXA12_03805 [Candidatus Woesearchaeota archaeon]|nr:hypothetical protein [Candidatus Woesearchaeota archaeon]
MSYKTKGMLIAGVAVLSFILGLWTNYARSVAMAAILLGIYYLNEQSKQAESPQREGRTWLIIGLVLSLLVLLLYLLGAYLQYQHSKDVLEGFTDVESRMEPCTGPKKTCMRPSACDLNGGRSFLSSVDCGDVMFCCEFP